MKCELHDLIYGGVRCPLCILDKFNAESDGYPTYAHWKDRGQIPPCAEYPQGWPPGDIYPGKVWKVNMPEGTVEPASATETQVGGNHYTKLAIQPMAFSMANGLDALQHTILKYVVRFRDKNGIEDLKKAKHCIEMLIEHETKLEK